MGYDTYITHSTVRDYAQDQVNLKKTEVDKYRAQLSRLQERLKTHIDEHPDYGFVKSRRAGSVMKGTALSKVNDMDLAVYVEADEASAWAESQLLDWMEARLKEALMPLGLKEDQFTQSTHCVTIEYKGSGLNVDAAPVLYEGEVDDIGYLVAKDTGKRVRTSVTQHLKFIRKRKEDHPDDFAQLVRLTKWWVRNLKRKDEDFRFKSFMVELIWAHLADSGESLTSYPAALETFFSYIVKSQLQERIWFSDYYQESELPAAGYAEVEIFDPVNPENNVAATYTKEDRLAIVEAATDAFDALSEAEFVETKGRAVELWQKVLGPTFKG